MKKFLFYILCVFVFGISASAQTINPSCFSNAKGWTITRIENTTDATVVYLQFYTYKSDYKFFINPGMYIEQYNKTGSARYTIKSFDGHELNRMYSVQPFTTYYFVLRFQRVPDSWTDINIAEPATAGYNAWYWKYVSLNRPESERLKLDDFVRKMVLDFCKTFAHPTNTLRKYTYSVNRNQINLTLYYEGNIVTDLEFSFDGKLVTDVSVIYDNDFINPFSLLTLIRTWIMENDTDGESTDMLEEHFSRTIREMTGRQLAAVALTVLWNTGK